MNINTQKSWINHSTIPTFWNLPVTLKEFLPYVESYLKQKNHDLISRSITADFFDKLLMQNFLDNSDSVISKVLNWIDLHFAEPINVQIISKLCHLSTSQLQRRFKKMMGQSIGEYWRVKRLQQAQFLLKNTKISIDEIAYSVGYANAPAFSRSFTQQFKISPSIWRNMHLSARSSHLLGKTKNNFEC
jgi:AraC-like DNA-binding protein